ncbi:SurA N-terminal domain-containing protein [Daejeonella oryzae]|uniref:SurA N-terminal domain-containing protein n=1 Tax=Daejeonella oryzae TaxID=1122943 RepID=UPI00042020EF|nr:SurA N-terminal domain-containing protein [Daejeonella oryzae]
MSFLRNRAGAIIVGVIGFAIVAFLLGDAIQVGTPFWQASQNEVGEVAGETISIQEFNDKVEVNSNNFKQQMGQSNLNAQMTAYVVENTWNQTISQILMDKEIKRLGMQVSKNELNDLITGKNPDPQVVQNFGDPQTGQVNRAQLNSFLDNIKTQDPNSELSKQWTQFLVNIRLNRLSEKYNNLVKNSLYVTSLEAREDYSQRNKLANFKYVSLDYSSIADAEIKLTDEDYKTYYNENKHLFKNPEETRTFEYVVFDANPSKEDSIETKARINKLVTDFRATTNDSLFVSINSDTKTPVSYVRKGQLDPALDSLVFSASSGTLVGPIFSNGTYRLAKVLDVKVGPDSVTASHILINPAAEGGLDKAKVKADSIKNLIQSGASFAELAAKFGTDGSKEKGGELGTFARGAMVPAFEEVVFNGKPGDLKVISTQFGVHVIKINAQKGSSKVAKVALVDKALASSNKTQQEAYGKASAFLSQADNAKSFDEQVKKSGYRKLIAENVNASQASIAGIENPRELVRWAFKSDEGDVSDQVFEMDNKFVIAKLITVSEKGTLALDKVKNQIEPMVRKQVKAKKLKEKLTNALSGVNSIDQLAQKVGKTAVPVQNVVFANPMIPGVAQENKVVGTVFGSKPGKLSPVIEGENGVYVIVLNGFSNPAPLTNAFKQKAQISQGLVQRAPTETFKVLRDKAEIKDNRVKFF